jgi:hypothetical protein
MMHVYDGDYHENIDGYNAGFLDCAGTGAVRYAREHSDDLDGDGNR